MKSPAAVVTQPLIRPLMPELDCLRGIAILLVLFFHGFDIAGIMTRLAGLPRLFVGATLGGWTGVYLFFVLSGFLITGILLDSKSRPDYYRRFYFRRAMRILPAFYLVLLLLCVSSRLGWLEDRRVGWPFVLLSFFYLANMVSLFGVPSQYTVLWSLAVEEHFYFLWPTAVRRFSRRAVIGCTIGLCLLCPFLRAVAYRSGHATNGGYTWLVADSLAMGALLAALSRGTLSNRVRMMRFSFVMLIAGLGLLATLTPFGIWRGSTFSGSVFRLTAINLCCTGILGFTLLLGISRWRAFVQRPILRFFGEISYGLYLIHMMAADFIDHWMIRFFPSYYPQLLSHFDHVVARFVLNTTIAVGIAFLSRRYFEEPFLKLKDRFTSSASDGRMPPLPYADSRQTQRTA